MHFDEELKELNTGILKMAAMVEESIHLAVDALKNRDEKLASKVIADDGKIDEKEIEIEDYALTLLSRHQPQAGDLRFIINAIKINRDLERIADLSVDICQRTIELAKQPILKPLMDVLRISLIARDMVRNAINSFVNRDVNLARKVIFSDQEIDNLRNQVQKELIYDYMGKNCADAPWAVSLLLIARHLERISDHAVNIAEDIIYMVNGEVVRHHPERLG